MARSPITLRITANHLPAITAAQVPAAARVVGATGYALEAGIKRRTHVISTRLRNSWVTDHQKDSLTAIVSTDVGYSIPEYYGTRFRRAHPGPQPAAAEQQPLFVKRMVDALNRAAQAR